MSSSVHFVRAFNMRKAVIKKHANLEGTVIQETTSKLMETQCYNIEVNFSKNESSHVMVKVKQGKRSFLCPTPTETMETFVSTPKRLYS